MPDPLAGVDPPPAPPAIPSRPAWMTNATRIFGSHDRGRRAVHRPVRVRRLLAQPVDRWYRPVGHPAVGHRDHGIGGTISLCQGTFAAIGAFTTAQLVDRYDLSVIGAMVVGALLAAAVGALLGFPIIRLAGIYPALATLAFKLMFERHRAARLGVRRRRPVPEPRPLVGSIDMANDRPYLIFCTLCLAILGLGVVAIAKGTTGRFLDALAQRASRGLRRHPPVPDA